MSTPQLTLNALVSLSGFFMDFYSFDDISIDTEQKDPTDLQNIFGWLVVGTVALCLVGNCLYLFPVKIYETLIL